MASTGGTVAVPKASAATACAPPTAYTSSIPSSRATTSVASAGFGVTTETLPTPATRAGTAVITSDDGSGWRPLGTQTPTASSGSQRRSETMPGAASTEVSAGC